MSKTKETYEIHCECGNCGWNGQLAIEKGREVDTTEECPNCECETAKKIKNQTSIGFSSAHKWEEYHRLRKAIIED